jgi:TRAP-type C4-dicarboxylate transport system substrate-binding protein
MRPIHHDPYVRIWTTACVLAAAAAAGCGGSGDVDRAGVASRPKPVELVLANHEGSSHYASAWGGAVERLSGGSIQVRIVNNWRAGEKQYEQAALRDVGGGKVDLASVAARAYDEVGVTSFQPLVAPMLIDSRELESRVLRGDLGRQALAGAEKLGVVGLALLPTELRRPVGITRTLKTPEDFDGARIYTREGAVARETLRALGAEPVHTSIDQWSNALDGAEVGLAAVRGKPAVARRAAGVTANVVLWPQPMTIVMNQQVFDRLSEAQQNALRDAGDAAFERHSRLASTLADEHVVTACRMGAELVEATPADVDALNSAVEPVYRTIERGAGNRAAIESIRQLKGDAKADTISCPGDTPAAPDDDARAELEGTFRMNLSEQELAQSPQLEDPGEVNDQNWGELTLRLKDGSVQYKQRNERDQFEASGTYTTDGDALEMRFDDIAETWVYRWSLYRGTLKLERDESLGVPPERFTPSPQLVKPWRRIG